jgi:hypothetical protein
MFEYMDGIVDAVEEIGQAAVDVAVFVTICAAKAVLIITAPGKPAVRAGQAKTAQACKKNGKADK